MKLNILEVCRDYGIKLDNRGLACCPLHKEKTPSFKIYRETNSFYCFGCNEGGDAVNLLALLTGRSNDEVYAEVHKTDEPINRSKLHNKKLETNKEMKAKKRFANWCSYTRKLLVFFYKNEPVGGIYSDIWCEQVDIQVMAEYLIDYLDRDPVKFYKQYKEVAKGWKKLNDRVSERI